MVNFNQDGVFFSAIFKRQNGVQLKTTVATEDIISLSISEQMQQIPSFSLKLFDPSGIYSEIFTPMTQVYLTWGIAPLWSMNDRRLRREIHGIITGPSGGGDQNGVITLDLNTMTLDYRGQYKVYCYESGTYGDAVADLFNLLGVDPVMREITFADQYESCMGGRAIPIYETPFKALVRLAYEWHAFFRMGRTADGKTVACFVSDLSTSKMTDWITGQTNTKFEYFANLIKEGDYLNQETIYGNYQAVNKMASNPNVISYTWKDESMDNASGAGAALIIGPDGKPQVLRYIVPTESFKTAELDQNKVNAFVKANQGNEFNAVVDVASRGYNSTAEKAGMDVFFNTSTQTTAPQGTGLSANIKVLGCPCYTSGMKAEFGSGFPSRLGAKGRMWWMNKVNHTIDKSGYFCDIEVCDSYRFSPTGLVAVNML